VDAAEVEEYYNQNTSGFGTLTVSVADEQGNVTRIERRFGVAGGKP